MRVRTQSGPAGFALLILALAGAVAVAGSAAASTGPVDGAVMDLTRVIDVAAIAPAVPPGTGAAEGCSADRITVEVGTQSFRFSEEDNLPDDADEPAPRPEQAPPTDRSTACAEARLNIQHPAGATAFAITFEADRDIVGPANQQGGQSQQKQALREYGPSGALVAERNYYAPTDASSGFQSFTFVYPVPEGRANTTLAWYFEDVGLLLSEGSTSVLSSGLFQAVVRGLTVSYVSVPLPDSFRFEPEEREEDGFFNVTTRLRVTVPEDAALNGSVTSVSFRAPLDLDIGAITGPAGGDVSRERVIDAEQSGTRTLTITHDQIEDHGRGDYEFTFFTLRPVPPPPVVPPTRAPFLLLAALALPLPGAVLAATGVNAYRREATERYRQTMRALIGGFGVAAVYYLAVVAFVFVGPGLADLSIVPPSAIAWVVYVQLGALLVAFVALWRVGGRNLVTAMRADIKDRQARQQELERSNHELEQFAYVASHDLQEPLRMVASYADLLKRRYRDELDETATKYLDYAHEGATRMQALIMDLLEYSRLGRGSLTLVDVDMNVLVAQVRRTLDAQIRDTRGNVVGMDLPTVRADGTQLYLVMQNLVSNGLKFHDKEPPLVTITATDTGSVWQFDVKDNGIGIDQKHFDRIFLVFKRLHARSSYQGTGIGLAICERVIEAHGGRIWVSSTLGEGTTFHFTLPKP